MLIKVNKSNSASEVIVESSAHACLPHGVKISLRLGRMRQAYSFFLTVEDQLLLMEALAEFHEKNQPEEKESDQEDFAFVGVDMARGPSKSVERVVRYQ